MKTTLVEVVRGFRTALLVGVALGATQWSYRWPEVFSEKAGVNGQAYWPGRSA